MKGGTRSVDYSSYGLYKDPSKFILDVGSMIHGLGFRVHDSGFRV